MMIFKLQRVDTILKSERVIFLCSAHPLMLIDILSSSKIFLTVLKLLSYRKLSMGNNPKSINVVIIALRLCTSFNGD